MAPREARYLDAPAGFILAQPEARHAVRKHRPVARVEVQTPLLHFAEMRHHLGEQPPPGAHEPRHATEQLSVGQTAEIPKRMIVHGIPHIMRFLASWIDAETGDQPPDRL
jgi:hypothetical protein